jgi:hypothetical protein
MSQENGLERIDRKRLPLFYRVLLNVPAPAFMTSIVDRIPSGALWVIAGAVWMADLSLALYCYLLLSFSFPINVIMICVFQVAPLLVGLRIAADRFVRWWNSVAVGGYSQRDLRKVLEEYIAMQKTKSMRNQRGLRRILRRLLSNTHLLQFLNEVSAEIVH